MKIDMTIQFNGVDGSLLVENGKPLTVGKIITNALMGTFEEDKKLTGEEKADLFSLWFDKIKDKDKAEVTSKESELIRKRVGYAYAPIVVGQIYKLIE